MRRKLSLIEIFDREQDTATRRGGDFWSTMVKALTVVWVGLALWAVFQIWAAFQFLERAYS